MRISRISPFNAFRLRILARSLVPGQEAVISYTSYLEEIDSGNHDNVKAPQIAIDYWKLQQSASLRDVIIAVRADEANHRDVNHGFANSLSKEVNRGLVDVRAIM